MDIIIAFFRVWLICWMISVICYIGSTYIKLKSKGIPFRLINHMNGVASLLITWPLVLVIYLYSFKKKKN